MPTDLDLPTVAASERTDPSLRRPDVSDRTPVDLLLWASVRIYREGLCAALTADPRIGNVTAVADAGECQQALRSAQPEVLVLDALAQEALPVARSARDSMTGVVALGVAESPNQILAFAEAGVSAYVTRDQSLDSLIGSILAVAAGEARCTQKIAGFLLSHVATLAGERERRERLHVHLTARESQILSLVTDGLTNKQIAQRLSIELPTVKNHVHNVLEKLHVRTRAQAVAATTGLAPSVLISRS
jgi:two-component system nitrate/nitrite response regulator NarL